MGDVLDTLFSILPIAIAILWILRRFSRKSGAGKNRSQENAAQEAGASEESRPTGIRSSRLRDERRQQAQQQKTERKKTLDKVLARVAEFTEGMQEQGRPPGEDEQYDRIDRPWPGSTAAGKPVPRAVSMESHSVLVDMDDEETGEENKYRDDPKGPGTLERISLLSPLAQGILWSEILGTPAGLKSPEEEYR